MKECVSECYLIISPKVLTAHECLLPFKPRCAGWPASCSFCGACRFLDWAVFCITGKCLSTEYGWANLSNFQCLKNSKYLSLNFYLIKPYKPCIRMYLRAFICVVTPLGSIWQFRIWKFFFIVIRAVIKFLISRNLCMYTCNNLQVSWEYSVQWWLATPVTSTELSCDRCYGWQPLNNSPGHIHLW